jgi:hypothetical protein
MRIGNTVITKKAKKANKTQTQTQPQSTYEIRNDLSPHLMKSIGDKNKKTFEATDVLTLREYLKRTQHATELYVALRLVHDLGRQMQALLSGGHGIACFSADDVVVIMHRASDAFTHAGGDSDIDSRDDPQFLFLNDRLVFEVDRSDGTLVIDRAMDTRDAFLSPEMRDQHQHQHQSQSQPQPVHFKTAYYSAALLVLYFLLNVDVTATVNVTEDLRPIKGTKLQWFLLRCLNPVPAERTYIYI